MGHHTFYEHYGYIIQFPIDNISIPYNENNKIAIFHLQVLHLLTQRVEYTRH